MVQWCPTMNEFAEPEIVGLSFQLPRELADAFRELARANERTVSAELRLAMRAHLDAVAEETAA